MQAASVGVMVTQVPQRRTAAKTCRREENRQPAEGCARWWSRVVDVMPPILTALLAVCAIPALLAKSRGNVTSVAIDVGVDYESLRSWVT